MDPPAPGRLRPSLRGQLLPPGVANTAHVSCVMLSMSAEGWAPKNQPMLRGSLSPETREANLVHPAAIPRVGHPDVSGPHQPLPAAHRVQQAAPSAVATHQLTCGYLWLVARRAKQMSWANAVRIPQNGRTTVLHEWTLKSDASGPGFFSGRFGICSAPHEPGSKASAQRSMLQRYPRNAFDDGATPPRRRGLSRQAGAVRPSISPGRANTPHPQVRTSPISSQARISTKLLEICRSLPIRATPVLNRNRPITTSVVAFAKSRNLLSTSRGSSPRRSHCPALAKVRSPRSSNPSEAWKSCKPEPESSMSSTYRRSRRRVPRQPTEPGANRVPHRAKHGECQFIWLTDFP